LDKDRKMPRKAQQAKDLLEIGIQIVLQLTVTGVRGGRAREHHQKPVPVTKKAMKGK
jgi:hypothetical protein